MGSILACGLALYYLCDLWCQNVEHHCLRGNTEDTDVSEILSSLDLAQLAQYNRQTHLSYWDPEYIL